MELRKSEVDALLAALHADEQMGWCLTTSHETRLRTVMRLVAKCLLVDAGEVRICDGDGYAKVPERHRQGWKLTTEGKRIAGDLRHYLDVHPGCDWWPLAVATSLDPIRRLA
jgi:hypothetical protein